jgi:hypothetical protein
VTHFYCSDDRKHDYYFVTSALTDLIRGGGLGDRVRRVHFFSDGAASQFKNRFMFNWLSSFEEGFRMACQWNFFATCHGRGIWDAEGGRLKNKVQDVNRRTQQSGNIPIPNAAAVVAWGASDEGKRFCTSGSELEGRIIKYRRLHLLRNIRRLDRRDVATIKGTLSMYCVASTNRKGRVDYAKVTCYCAACIAGDWDHCSASDALGEWQPFNF